MCRILTSEDHQLLIRPLPNQLWSPHCERNAVDSWCMDGAFDDTSHSILATDVNQQTLVILQQVFHDLWLQLVHATFYGDSVGDIVVGERCQPLAALNGKRCRPR